MGRTPLVVLGAAISILGYAVVVNGLSNLIPTLFGGPVGIIDGLIPGSPIGGPGGAGGGRAKPSDYPKPDNSNQAPSPGGHGHNARPGDRPRPMHHRHPAHKAA